MIGRHEPKRRAVEWDGRSYIGNCRHCGAEIERVAHRNWKERLHEVT